MSEHIYYIQAATAAQAERWSRPLPSASELRRRQREFASAQCWFRRLRRARGWRRALVWRLCCLFAARGAWALVRRWLWAERLRLFGV